ncbi:TolB family protein [Marinilabilia sp.]
MVFKITFVVFLLGCFLQVQSQTYHDSPSDFFFSGKVEAQPLMMSPGFISSGMNECGGTLGKDKDEFYYWLKKEGVFSVILATRFVDGFWTYPEVEPFSGKYMDASPFLSPDGRFLYFTSNRPEYDGDGIANWNIWRCARSANDKWGTPQLMEFSNPNGNEISVSLDRDGNIYFCADYESETITLETDHLDIYFAPLLDNGNWGDVVKLGPEINTPGVEQTPAISPDGKCLVYSSARPGGEGTADLYVSFKENDSWTPGQNLGKGVNSSAYEHCPVFTADGNLLLFTSTREVKMPSRINYSRLKKWVLGPGNGAGDIWYVKSASVLKRR